MDLKPVLFVVGVLLCLLSLAMLPPAFADWISGHSVFDFIISATMTGFFGITLVLACWRGKFEMNLRQIFLMTNCLWLSIAGFGALPFLVADMDMSLADAFFEAMSGITTTGSTVMTGLDDTSHGILLWRGILQWFGGVGVVLMALSVLPMLNVGGMQMFKAEGFEQADKPLPRAAEIAASVALIYVGLTLLGIVAFYLTGMTAFDALIHAMTALSTGGYSTSDESLGHWAEPGVQVVAITLMILGSLPFALYISYLRNGLSGLHFDAQSRGFLVLLAVLVLIMTGWVWFNLDVSFSHALSLAAFNVTSIMTGTGFASADYSAWGPFANTFFVVIMFFGGCAGSTTCGIKIFRLQVLLAGARMQLAQLLEPRGVFVASYDGRRVSASVLQSVTYFFFLFILSFAVLALALAATGLDFTIAISSAATAICNVGPGIGEVVGPAGNFSSLNEPAKWLMAIGMLVGRLEVFSVMILLLPRFWQP